MQVLGQFSKSLQSLPPVRLGCDAAAGVTGVVIRMARCLQDNYCPIMHDPATGSTAIIDTPEFDPVHNELQKHGWNLTHILNTHHHWDHTGCNEQFLAHYPDAVVYGPRGEAAKIPGIRFPVQQDDVVPFGAFEGNVIDVGGHTKGHVAYHFPAANAVFCGDALFVLGCGRMFEGTPEQFYASLMRLSALPESTVMYCAHEYTVSNAKFALSVDPSNEALQQVVARATQLREDGQQTVPSVIGQERATNPFLRVDDLELRKSIDVLPEATGPEAFAKLRKMKDNF